MAKLLREDAGISSVAEADEQSVQQLKNAIASGKHWYIALLEAIRLWDRPEESYNGRLYRYLIDNEAFDWLLLAERLCQAVDDMVPEEGVIDLLFFNKPPIEVSKYEFKRLIGSAKYRAHLNYFYGVTVEEALILAVEKEVYKEQRTLCCYEDPGLIDEVYQRIYGAARAPLLRRFRAEHGYPQRRSITLGEFKEFTYWLFKYRLHHCDKSRVASDTNKGLAELQRHRSSEEIQIEPLAAEEANIIDHQGF